MIKIYFRLNYKILVEKLNGYYKYPTLADHVYCDKISLWKYSSKVLCQLTMDLCLRFWCKTRNMIGFIEVFVFNFLKLLQLLNLFLLLFFFNVFRFIACLFNKIILNSIVKVSKVSKVSKSRCKLKKKKSIYNYRQKRFMLTKFRALGKKSGSSKWNNFFNRKSSGGNGGEDPKKPFDNKGSGHYEEKTVIIVDKIQKKELKFLLKKYLDGDSDKAKILLKTLSHYSVILKKYIEIGKKNKIIIDTIKIASEQENEVQVAVNSLVSTNRNDGIGMINLTHNRSGLLINLLIEGEIVKVEARSLINLLIRDKVSIDVLKMMNSNENILKLLNKKIQEYIEEQIEEINDKLKNNEIDYETFISLKTRLNVFEGKNLELNQAIIEQDEYIRETCFQNFEDNNAFDGLTEITYWDNEQAYVFLLWMINQKYVISEIHEDLLNGLIEKGLIKEIDNNDLWLNDGKNSVNNLQTKDVINLLNYNEVDVIKENIEFETIIREEQDRYNYFSNVDDINTLNIENLPEDMPENVKNMIVWYKNSINSKEKNLENEDSVISDFKDDLI